MQQPGQYATAGLNNSRPWAYAVDVGFYGTVQSTLLREVMDRHGMLANLWNKGEWWHYVPADGVPVAVVSGHGMVGKAVEAVQRQLSVDPDGWHGPMTSAAVARWQRANGRLISGDWDTGDQAQWGSKRVGQQQAKQSSAPQRGLTPADAMKQIKAIVERTQP